MFLGIDLGTTNVKALAVDAAGRVVAEGAAPLDRYYVPGGGVEQDIDEIWTAAATAIRQVIDRCPAARIQALGVSSQGGAMQLLDGREEPIGRVISWLDGRGRPHDQRLGAELGEAFLVEHIGRHHACLVPGQILRLREETPEVWRRVARVAFVGDVIVGRLCGRRAHEATSLSIAMLLNPSLGRADPPLLTRLGVTEDQLPNLLPITTPAGPLAPEAARATGLDAGIPVSVAVHDQYAAALGAGSVGAGDVSLGTGTAWVLVANVASLRPPATPETFVCPHPVPGLFGQMLSMSNGGSALEWVLGLAGAAGASGERIDAMLDSAPPGSEGLLFWPLLTPSGWCEPFARPGGRLLGIRLAHGPAHLMRAVVEGLACELARHVRHLAASGIPVRRLATSGAAAASRVTPQILADVVGLPVACICQPALSAFGASIVARALVDRDTPLAELSRRLAPTSQTVEPGENRAVYHELLVEYLEPFSERG